MMQASEQGRPDGRFQLLGGRVGYEKLEAENQVVSLRAEVASDLKSKLVQVPEKQGWRKLLAYFGPGFLVAIAYMDPGNFESDLQAGAKFKYELLWVLLLATTAGLLIQSLAANLGVVTGRHLSEHCRAEYGKQVNFVLWLLAEVAIVASDIPEVIGTAYALNMLFRLPLWIGVLLTGFSTLLFLALQQYGVRKLEIFIGFLVLVMASCFFVEVAYAKPAAGEVVKGLLVPSLRGQGATAIAISLIGAMVMPHNLYLHSALVLTRKTPRTDKGIRDGCRCNLIECSFALLVSFVVNIAVVAVSGAVCSKSGLSEEDLASCQDLDLNRASFLLRNVLGSWSSTVFALALLASGQSSTITGTFAGQYVMQGFLELRFAPWLRNMVTRCVAIVPSLAVALIGGESGAGKLIIVSSMILSFELPFALLPLLKFTSNSVKMGPHVNDARVTRITWVVGCLIIVINVYFLGNAFIHWMISSRVARLRLALIGIVGSAGLICYVAFILYLAIRQDSIQTCLALREAEEQEFPVHAVKEMNGWIDPGTSGTATTVPLSPLVTKVTSLEAPATPLLAVATPELTDVSPIWLDEAAMSGVLIVSSETTAAAHLKGTDGGGATEHRGSGSAL